MINYTDQLTEKKFVPNVVILFRGSYYCSRVPDSGLAIDADKVGLVKSLTINPTSVDPARASTTISSTSFALLDKNGVVSSKFLNQPLYMMAEEVKVYLGRSNVGMSFAGYFELPTIYIAKSSKNDGAWNFQCEEKRDRINKKAFFKQTKLSGDILAATTTITVKDVSTMNTSGLAKVESEFFSYSGVDLVNNFLTGCVRGERNTIPVDHGIGSDVFQADEMEGNPIDILQALLISQGGGGVYDLLIDGAGIDESLVDLDQFEDVKNSYFAEMEMDFSFSAMDSLQEFIENEILFPLGLRLRTNANSKIGLAVINRTYLDIDLPEFDADNITKNPSFEVVDDKVFNRIRVLWDYSEAVEEYLDLHEVFDQDSIDVFGDLLLEIRMKGPTTLLNGLEIVQEVANQFLKRFSVPRPEISLSMQMDASVALIGDKVDFNSNLVVDTDTGLLSLRRDLEVISRSVNYQTGDVTTKLAFTWYSEMRQCFISPTDSVVTITSQSKFTIPSGRGDLYRKDWVMKLFDSVAGAYVSAQTNTILEISGDEITFSSPWLTTLTTNMRMMFADYDEVVEQQQKFCFISDGSDFSDGKKQYQITS